MGPVGSMDTGAASRYLAHLGVARHKPSLAALAELVTAHLARVPFENVSKLVLAARGVPPGLPNLDRFLEDMETHGLGGTCYVLNPFLGDLLRHLGYAVELRGADMDQPDVHVVNVVTLEDSLWLVDVGYGAPFFAPLPLTAPDPVAVVLDGFTYVLHPPDPQGRSRLDQQRDGEVVHGYVVTPEARDPREFTDVVVDSYRPDSPFLSQLRIIRHRPGRSAFLRGHKARLIVDGNEQELDLPDRTDMRRFVTEEFGIATGPLDQALDWLEERRV